MIFLPVSSCLIEKVLNRIFDLLNDRSANLVIRQLVLCLRFKDRILHFDENGPDNPFAHIDALKIFLRILIDPFQDPFSESR